MNQKTRLRLWAFGSLITIFLIFAYHRKTAIEAVRHKIVYQNVEQIQQYKLAKWHYHLVNLLSPRKIYSQDSKKATKDTKSDRSIDALTVVRTHNKNADKQIAKYSYKGYADRQGRIIIPAVFDTAREFSRDRAVVKFRGKYGIIDRQGEIVTPFMFDYIYSYDILAEGGYIAAKIDGREGRTNLDGKTIVPFIYDSIESYSIKRDYVIATKDLQKGIANLAGKTIVPFEYDEILKHTADVTIVEKDEDIGVVNRQKEYVSLKDSRNNNSIKANHDFFVEDVAMLRFQDGDTERYCVVNRQGEILVSAQSIRPIKQRKIDNLCRAITGIKVDNSKVKSANYPANSPKSQEKSYEHLFTDGLLQVYINGQVRYVNLAGELIIWTEQFDQMGDFSEGLAAFVKDDRYGFVDRQGKIAFYLEKDMVAASYAAHNSNYHHTNTTDWIFFPAQFSKFKNGLAEITHMDGTSLTTSWDCPAYEESPLGKAYVDKTGKIVKYEPIIPPSTVYSEVGGSEGNYQDVDCDLRSYF